MPDPPVVLVTGCTQGGIGYALCERFREHGCCVYATARRPATMAGLQEQGIHTLQLDVTSTAEIRAVIQHIQQQSGRLDIVINNAGTGSAQAAGGGGRRWERGRTARLRLSMTMDCSALAKHCQQPIAAAAAAAALG